MYKQIMVELNSWPIAATFREKIYARQEKRTGDLALRPQSQHLN